MRELLNENQKHLLWKDEIDDEFLLTKFLEIFVYNKKKFKCYCWSKNVFNKLQKKGIITLKNITDDKLYVFYTDVKNLPILLAMGVHSRRPNINGEWLDDKKERLSHDIIKPGKLESLNDTNKNYEVTVNGIAFNIKATSRSKAKYKTWKKHPHYNKSITSMKNVKIKKLREQSNSVATDNEEQ